MKKRIVCVLLTLIMLVSLVPAAALTASAAGYATSEAAITVLKQLEGYSREAYEDPVGSGYWSIGYGTPSKEGATTTEAEADVALRKHLVTLNNAVNNFAAKNGLALTQSKHDALVLFSYNCGTAWMSSTGVFKSAVVSGATGSEFLNAIVLWRNVQDTENAGLLNRRLCEANMYLNGVYSNVAPSNYTYVEFDADGGNLDEGDTYKQFYDASTTVSPEPVPTMSGYTFMGWYTDAGAWVRYLTAAQAKTTLVAHWQDNADPQPTAVSYKMSISQFTSRQPLASPDKDAKKWGEEIKAGKTVEIVEDFLDANGSKWCRVSGSGWLKVGRAGASDVGTATDVVVTVTNTYLNMRRNPSITSTQVGKWNNGDRLRIIATHQGQDGFLWGEVAKSASDASSIGWVALMYTNYNSVKDTTDTSTSTAHPIATATVLCSNYVNVRSAAGVSNPIVSALANGTVVDVYEITTVNGHQWGRISSGWFCLSYSKLTMLNTSGSTVIVDPSVLAYSFTGKLINANVYENAGDVDTIETKLEDGAAITIIGVKDVNGVTWGKIGTGWVNIDDDVELDVAKYKVICASLNVRSGPSADYERIDQLSKGVELEITEIKVVGFTVWGYTEKYSDITDFGWVNLDSANVQRTNAPSGNINNNNGTTDSESVSGLVATVVNTDKVNVRLTGAMYGKVIGSMTRGTTALVLEEKDGWYNLDYDVDGDPSTGSWVSGKYLDVKEGTISSGGSNTGSNTGSGNASTSGYGIIANTYSGVNVRSGPGTANALLGKILTGTVVKIYETTTVGASKWARVDEGWICMDYVNMLDDIPEDILATLPGYGGGSGSNGGASTDSTAAIYTGYVDGEAVVYKQPDMDAELIRVMSDGERVTIHELLAVTEKVTSGTTDNGDGTTSNTTTEVTSYWARTNEGWVFDPENTLKLDTLDDVTFTLTGNDVLNVRVAAGVDSALVNNLKLKKGDQVKISKLEIIANNVWGEMETADGKVGWICMEYMSLGAVNVNTNTNNGGNAGNTGNNGNTGSTGGTSAGVAGSTGNTGAAASGSYLYTGKIINTPSVNVRALASTASNITTTLKRGASIVIYETVIADAMAWGRCDAGWVYLYYVDLTPAAGSAIDARVVYTEGTEIYSGAGNGNLVGTYAKMAVIDIYEVVGKWARTDLGWVHTDNLL